MKAHASALHDECYRMNCGAPNHVEGEESGWLPCNRAPGKAPQNLNVPAFTIHLPSLSALSPSLFIIDVHLFVTSSFFFSGTPSPSPSLSTPAVVDYFPHHKLLSVYLFSFLFLVKKKIRALASLRVCFFFSLLTRLSAPQKLSPFFLSNKKKWRTL
jgi:hypothetical protein